MTFVGPDNEAIKALQEEQERHEKVRLDAALQQDLSNERERIASHQALDDLKATLAQTHEQDAVAIEADNLPEKDTSAFTLDPVLAQQYEQTRHQQQSQIDFTQPSVPATSSVPTQSVEPAQASTSPVKPTTTIEQDVQAQADLSNEAKRAQHELAEIIAASTPETTRLSFVAPSHCANTPANNKSPQQHAEVNVDRTEKVQAILNRYEVQQEHLRDQIVESVQQVETALHEVHGPVRDLEPHHIDNVNNVLIDFHRSVERSVEHDILAQTNKVEVDREQNPKVESVTATSQAAPGDPQTAQRNLQAQQDFHEEAHRRAKLIADEVTAQVIRQNRQLAYLEQIDNLRRQRDDQEKSLVTKKELERAQALLDPERATNPNIDAGTRTLIEQRKKELEQSDTALSTDGPDIGGPQDPFNRTGGGGDGDGIEFEMDPYLAEYYNTAHTQAYVLNETGAADRGGNQTHADVFAAEANASIKNAGLQKAPVALNISATDHGYGDHTFDNSADAPTARYLEPPTLHRPPAPPA